MLAIPQLYPSYAFGQWGETLVSSAAYMRDLTLARLDRLGTELSDRVVEPAEAEENRPGKHSSRPAFRILVVDDEKAVREYFHLILQEAGFQVWLASDGEEALARMRERPFHLVLMDLVMPDREGLETIETVRRDYPEVRIVAVSGAFGGKFLKVAQALGADGILMKPVSPEQLLETVRRMAASLR